MSSSNHSYIAFVFRHPLPYYMRTCFIDQAELVLIYKIIVLYGPNFRLMFLIHLFLYAGDYCITLHSNTSTKISTLFLVIGNLSTDVFETRTATGTVRVSKTSVLKLPTPTKVHLARCCFSWENVILNFNFFSYLTMHTLSCYGHYFS